MTQLYFHCLSDEGILLDRHGSEIDDFSEACEHAAQVVRKCVASPGPQDWRNWIMRVSDQDGEELFLVPFSTVLGRLH